MAELSEEQKRIKKLEDQIARKQAALVRAKGRLSEKERRARNRKLFEAGRLVEAAGLLDTDPAFILGHLLSGAQISPTSERWKTLQTTGKEELKNREKEKKKKGKDA